MSDNVRSAIYGLAIVFAVIGFGIFVACVIVLTLLVFFYALAYFAL